MDKKYELLKVKHEDARTWLFTFLAIALSTSIGYYTIEDVVFKRTLARISFLLIGVIIYFDVLQIVRYSRIIKYLKK